MQIIANNIKYVIDIRLEGIMGETPLLSFIKNIFNTWIGFLKYT